MPLTLRRECPVTPPAPWSAVVGAGQVSVALAAPCATRSLSCSNMKPYCPCGLLMQVWASTRSWFRVPEGIDQTTKRATNSLVVRSPLPHTSMCAASLPMSRHAICHRNVPTHTHALFAPFAGLHTQSAIFAVASRSAMCDAYAGHSNCRFARISAHAAPTNG